jgi:hypothetical protein
MRRFAFVLAFGVLVGGTGEAHAERPAVAKSTPSGITKRVVAFSASEKATLLAGDSVTRPMSFQRRGGRYVGGVAYQVLDASPAEVLNALGSAELLPNMLPRTKSARLVGVGHKHAKIELVSGTSVAEAKYTVVFKRRGRNELRFWLDKKRPHDIKDVWGYVRVRPFGKGSLLTVGVALDVGPGVVRMLFEDRIQRAILSTPQKIRDYLAPRALAKKS